MTPGQAGHTWLETWERCECGHRGPVKVFVPEALERGEKRGRRGVVEEVG
jgi:hypothetical protein